MKEIILKKIQLSNFKSLNLEVEFNEKSTKISGQNGIGKTSVASAFYWLLSSYTSPYVPKNHALFDDRVELTHETPLAKVKAWLKVGDYDYTIEKTAEAKFTRSKGSSEWVKASSDTYTVYIDEIETSATAYNEWISNNICPVEMLVYAMSGDFFSYLVSDDKNKARKVLTEIAGEVKAEDFKGDYSSIKELLERYTASEIVEMSKKKKKPLEDRQNIIPLEIDRKEERLSELRAMDFSSYEKAIEDTKERIEAIDGLLLGNADALKPILEHNREIENKVGNLRLSLVNGRLDYKEEQNARTSKIKGKIADIRRFNEGVEKENAKRKEEAEAITMEISSKKLDLALHEEMRNSLLKERDEIKARVFTGDTCAYCGQELPYDKLEEEREKFNLKKKSDLENVVARGKRSAEAIATIKECIEKLEEIEGRGIVLEEKKSTTELEDAFARVEASFVPYEETDEFKRINAEIEALLSEMKEIPSNDNEALTIEKKGLIEELSELSKKLGLKDEIGKVEKEVAELRGELRSVACSIAELEGQIFKAKEYEQEKHQIVSFRINDKLEYSKIEMWSTQKNGDVVSDCLLFNKCGVKFSSTNGADRILIQLDLQKLFLRHFGLALPVWVDESSIFDSKHLPKDDNYQFVYLFASDSPYLCVE